jgi:hypothetical protein
MSRSRPERHNSRSGATDSTNSGEHSTAQGLEHAGELVGRAEQGFEEMEPGGDLRVVALDPAGHLRPLIAVDRYQQEPPGSGASEVDSSARWKSGSHPSTGRRAGRKTTKGASPFAWISQTRSSAT